MGPATVYYDGQCGMCRGMAAWAGPRARRDALRFVDNGSEEGRTRLMELGLLERSDETLVVEVGQRIETESGAAVEVVRRLRWPYRALTAMVAVPRPMRDWGYRQVAKRRGRACALH